MNLKSTFALTLLLALAAIPALADDPMATGATKDVGIPADGTPSTPVHEDSTQPPKLDELLPGLTGVNFIELSTGTLTCAEIDGTPCTTQEDCGSCYPHPTCPLTPCYCGYGVCQCDI